MDDAIPCAKSSERSAWYVEPNLHDVCLAGWLVACGSRGFSLHHRQITRAGSHRGFGGRIVFDLRADAVPWRSDNPVARTPKIKVRVPR